MDSMGAWELPEEYRMIQESARRFMVEEVQPAEASVPHDSIDLLPDDLKRLRAKARELGFWMFRSPAEYGGAGLNLLGQAVVAEESARCRMGLYVWGGGAFGLDPPEMIWAGTPEQIERWGIPTVAGERDAWFAMSEPSGGSDPARAIRTRAVRDGDHYILNGQKTWISGAGISDWGIVFARTGNAERGGITAFIVDNDTPGFSASPIPVIRAHPAYDVYFTDCRIPANQRLGAEGEGFAILDRFFGRNRIPYTINCIGAAQMALEKTIEWVTQRETFGSRLADKQAVQWMLAESEIELRAARLLIYQAAWNADLGKPMKVESSVAKVYGTETAYRVVDRCIQLWGGLGVTYEMPFERWWRELRIHLIGEGPSEIHRMVVARHLLGKVKA